MEFSKEILNEFKIAETELKRVENKLEYYRTHPLTSEHGIVQGSMKEFPYAQKSFKLSAPNVKSDRERNEKVANLLIQLNAKRKHYEALLFEIDCAIENIADTEIRIILQRKYIDKWSDKEIAEELHYETCTIRKKIDRFLMLSHNSQTI